MTNYFCIAVCNRCKKMDSIVCLEDDEDEEEDDILKGLLIKELKELHNSKNYQDLREMQNTNIPSSEQLIRWLN